VKNMGRVNAKTCHIENLLKGTQSDHNSSKRRQNPLEVSPSKVTDAHQNNGHDGIKGGGPSRAKKRKKNEGEEPSKKKKQA